MQLLMVLGFGALASLSSSVSAIIQGSANPWDQYILSPTSRDILPSSVFATTGDVTLNETNSYSATLFGNGSTVTFDFGQQVNGFITLQFGATTTSGAALGVAFTENKAFIGVTSDNSTDSAVSDGTIYALAVPEGAFTFGREFARGSYRYLTLSNNNFNTTIQVTGVSTHFTAAPSTAADQLRDYSGYFYSDDDLLNRIWYAGAYTVQLCSIAANESRATPTNSEITTTGWYNNATITGVDTAAEVYVDGARRDRTPWPGDYGVAVLSKTVSLNGDNLGSVRNSIKALYSVQGSEGQFAYAGPPLAPGIQYGNVNSNTYHLWTLIAIADYTSLSGNTDFFVSMWNQTLLGFKFILAHLDATDSLLNVTATHDWGRVGQEGKTIVGNTLLYHALNLHSTLATELGLEGTSYNDTSFEDIAIDIKAAVNENLWDASAGMFYDNTTAKGHQLYPQDGNSLAVHLNITDTAEQAASISAGLSNRWNEFGAVCPEGEKSISPFITSFEVDAQFLANPGDASKATELIRRQWGYMLNKFSNSTLMEGYYYTGELYYTFYGAGQESYISHAHAWSTGPVASLTLKLGGLAPISGAGTTWAFKPHAAGAGVGSVQTGYSLETGSFSAEWKTVDKDNHFFEAGIVTPSGTSGSISIPTFGKSLSAIQISVNGKTIWKRGRVVSSKYGFIATTNDYVTVTSVDGGWYSIVAKTSS